MKSNIYKFTFWGAFFLFFSTNLFGGGNSAYTNMSLTSELSFDRYVNGNMPTQIIERHPTREYIRNYEYLGDGLVIIECYNEIDSLPPVNRYARYLCYNEYYNENINSPYKINEFIQIMQLDISDTHITEFSLNITRNYHDFTNYNRYNILVEYRQNRFQYGQNETGIVTAVLVFDNESKRLSDLQVTIFRYPIIHSFINEKDRVEIRINNYEYIYDDYGRLENVYFIHNGEHILIKKYFYDGILRTFEQPFFNDLFAPTLEEIVIYDDNILRYHLKLYYGPHHYRDRDTVEERNMDYFYVIFEYDENKNEIQQTKYFGVNNTFYSQYEYVIIYSDILETNNFGNWIQQITHSEIYELEQAREIIRNGS